MTPFRKMKTSDFFGQNIGTFEAKVRHFLSKKSDVFNFRKTPFFWGWEGVERGAAASYRVTVTGKGVE